MCVVVPCDDDFNLRVIPDVAALIMGTHRPFIRGKDAALLSFAAVFALCSAEFASHGFLYRTSVGGIREEGAPVKDVRCDVRASAPQPATRSVNTILATSGLTFCVDRINDYERKGRRQT